MNILNLEDKAFKKYGREIMEFDFSELIEGMRATDIPEQVVYEPSIAELESLSCARELERAFFGELPIQIGYCNGHNTKLNAVEYHRNSEINLAVTDAVLLLGHQADVTQDYTYDTSLMEAFLVPAGTAVELYATTLHYAPCHVEDTGFRVSVILPRGTNFPLEQKHDKGEDRLITAKNKWLIGHPEGGLPADSFIGLIGENLDISKS